MIYLYTGTPGSFKSAHATREIIDYLERGKNVIANYPVRLTEKAKKKGGKFIYMDSAKITAKELYNFAKENHNPMKSRKDRVQTLVVIDESQILFNSREFRMSNRMEWISFFSKHRHLFFNVILIAQTDRAIDRQIRELAEHEVKHRNISEVGKIGLLMKILRIEFFVAVYYNRTIGQKESSEFMRLTKKDIRAYDSFLDFDSSDNEKENNAIEISQRSENEVLPQTHKQKRGSRGSLRLVVWLRGIWSYLNRPVTELSICKKRAEPEVAENPPT